MAKTTQQPATAADPQNPNMAIFNFARSVPAFAKKDIKAGKLKGYTNISPQWRLEKLTELFGPVGIGWNIENIKYWTSEGMGECVMWCSLDLKVFYNGQWSQPINGIGGSKLYGKGQGDGINDEACKMAQTDALSVACKNLGFASDVYYGLDDTKYRDGQQDFAWGGNYPAPGMTPPPPPGQAPQPAYQGAPAPAQSQPQPGYTPAPAPQQPTLEEVIGYAVNAQSGQELTQVWNTYKAVYGKNSQFKKAIADNPNNPSKNR